MHWAKPVLPESKTATSSPSGKMLDVIEVPGTTPQPLLLQPSKPVAVTVHWAKPLLPPESKTATSAPLDSTLDVIALPGTTPQPLLLQP